MKNNIPKGLTLFRAALAPVLVWLAAVHPDKVLFGLCLTGAFLSDVFDGIIARRLGVATPALRRMDSIADSLFYVAGVFAVWRLAPSVIDGHAGGLKLLLALELLRYAFDFGKFRREASYHMWTSKLWGIALFLAFFSVLALGDNNGTVGVAVWLGVIADLEGLAISVAIPEWQSDIPSLLHALRLRRASYGR